jgi:predicted XRE-type DNA-binding protein
MKELIERVQKHIEEIGDCWEWQGAMQPNSPTPMMNYKRVCQPVRRVLAREMGKSIDGKFVTCKCRNELCVNPDHLLVVTRKRLQEIVSKERNYTSNPVRNKKLAEKARLRCKLTVELAAEVREAEGTQRQIAARFGISQATVSVIKRGQTWRDYSNPFAQLIGGLHK